MLTFSFGERFSTPCALVLGGFDGLHLGHRRLLFEAEKTGLPVVLTAMYGAKGKQLFTRAEREFVFAEAGVFAACSVPFTEQLQATSAEEFLGAVFRTIPAEAIVCGEDFRFGKGAEGTADLLRRTAGCPVLVVKTVKYLAEEGGRARKISTSACKTYLKAGDLPRLNACLCPREEDFSAGAYFVQGAVEHGRGVGRTYGFPTLNLSVPPEKLLPPDGVYGGLCATAEGNFPCILNIGARPTFGVEERKLEAYLQGFSGDLYGETVRVYPTEFFRPICKFSSPEALKEQLERDKGRLDHELRTIARKLRSPHGA